MVSPIANTGNGNYAGIGIYCNVIDPSKLPPDHPLLQGNMPNCTVIGPNNCAPAPNYGPGYYTGNYTKKRITILTDAYMQKLDNLLQSEDKKLREYAAREVVKRFEEDKTRYDDKGLNVLVNKMLMDPYDRKVRGRGLMLLQTKLAKGDENTMAVLDKLAQDPTLDDKDRGLIDICKVQLTAQTELINVPTAPTVSQGV